MIGDVHAEDALLASALESLRSCEAILCVGDVVDGRGDVERTCALLRDEGVITVRGNHDRWLLRGEMRKLPDSSDIATLSPESLAWLASLPATIELETIEGPLLLCHAVGDDDMKRMAEDDEGYALRSNSALQRVLEGRARVMICGHTHIPYVRRIDHLVIVNAGTLYRDHDPSVSVVDLEQRIVERRVLATGATVRTALP